MSFKKNKYVVIKKAISKDLANFLYNYITTKKIVANTLIKNKYISPYDEMFGTWHDKQVKGTYSHYADVAMETLLLRLHPLMEKELNAKLIPCYSYTRVYKTGDILERHVDREACEISTTMFLGGDPWPIYLKNKKYIEVNLKPGDMLVYKGCDLEHWRDEFEGEECAQVFLHYNRDTKENQKNLYDGRIHVGLPKIFFNYGGD